jgi:hypothetical protein
MYTLILINIAILGIIYLIAKAMDYHYKKVSFPKKNHSESGLNIYVEVDSKDAQIELGHIEEQVNRIHSKICMINETILKGRADHERTIEKAEGKTSQVSGRTRATESPGSIHFGAGG